MRSSLNVGMSDQETVKRLGYGGREGDVILSNCVDWKSFFFIVDWFAPVMKQYMYGNHTSQTEVILTNNKGGK